MATRTAAQQATRKRLRSDEARETERRRMQEQRGHEARLVQMLSSEFPDIQLRKSNFYDFLLRLAGFEYDPETYTITKRPKSVQNLVEEASNIKRHPPILVTVPHSEMHVNHNVTMASNRVLPVSQHDESPFYVSGSDTLRLPPLFELMRRDPSTLRTQPPLTLFINK
jgi:hypothetical protein